MWLNRLEPQQSVPLAVLYIRLILCQLIYLLWVSGAITVMATHQWQLIDWLGSCRSDAVWQEQIVHQFICSALSENHFYFCYCSIWHTSLTFVLTERPGIKEKERPFVNLLLSDVHWSWASWQLWHLCPKFDSQFLETFISNSCWPNKLDLNQQWTSQFGFPALFLEACRFSSECSPVSSM